MKEQKVNDPSVLASRFDKLVQIVHRLRAPGGCPWDREQTPLSLKPYLIEETYEVIDAIDNGDAGELCEELGDVLLQVVLQAEIAREQGDFAIEDVIEGISNKLIERHPHVFGETKVADSKEVLVNWEKIKKKEKKGRGLFEGLPRDLPALQRAWRIGEKAGRVGFDWSDGNGVRMKVEEELKELDEAVSSRDPGEIEHELGDLLFAVAQWARHLKLRPEETLRTCCARFVDRFEKMERAVKDAEKSMNELEPDEFEVYWQQAKRS